MMYFSFKQKNVFLMKGVGDGEMYIFISYLPVGRIEESFAYLMRVSLSDCECGIYLLRILPENREELFAFRRLLANDEMAGRYLSDALPIDSDSTIYRADEMFKDLSDAVDGARDDDSYSIDWIIEFCDFLYNNIF